MRLALLALLAWVGWVSAASASAAGPRARLSWERPSPSMCPSAEMLEGDVRELLGHDPFAREGEPDLLLQGHVEERTDAVYARIEAKTAGGQSLGVRELTAPHGECPALRKPLALVIGLFLEAEPGPSISSPRARTPLWLGAGLGLRSDLLPRTTPGLSMGVLARLRPRFDLAAQASYWFPVTIETSAGLGARMQALDATLELCPRLTPGSDVLGVYLCGALQAGLIGAVPRGLDDASRKQRFSAAGLLELKLSGALPHKLLLEGTLGGVVALTQPLFYLTRSDGSTLDVHRPDRFGVLLRLTLFFQLSS